jgi:hypothetical protein
MAHHPSYFSVYRYIVGHRQQFFDNLKFFEIVSISMSMMIEAISKLGFWSKVKADPSFNPQAY